MEMDITPLSEGLMKVTLVGRLDSPGVDRIETRLLASLVPAGCSAIIDLSRVDFVASMGLRMIMSAARSLRSRNARLAVYGAQRPVNDVFEQVSFGQIVPVRSTEAEALVAVALSPV